MLINSDVCVIGFIYYSFVFANEHTGLELEGWWGVEIEIWWVNGGFY